MGGLDVVGNSAAQEAVPAFPRYLFSKEPGMTAPSVSEPYLIRKSVVRKDPNLWPTCTILLGFARLLNTASDGLDSQQRCIIYHF